MTARNPTIDDVVLQRLAETVAKGSCVWLLGAGFSAGLGLPSARKLAALMVTTTFIARAGEVQEAALVKRYEEFKRNLVGEHYADRCPQLTRCDTFAAVAAEVQQLAAAIEVGEPWADPASSLGRVADALYDTHDLTRLDGHPEVELGRAMCMDQDMVWSKAPGLSHHLLALLMYEGLVKHVVTTNYDCLLEEACWKVGHDLRPARMSGELRVDKDEKHAQLYKIHGCREWFKKALADGGEELFAAAEALVVRETELGDWRGPKWEWAKDLFHHLLRRYPFVFVGFSASDTVIQKSIKGVAKEPGAEPPPLFVCCLEMTPGLKRSLRERQGYDSDHPPIFEVPGDKLLQDLYAEAMGFHFGLKAVPERDEVRTEPPPEMNCPDDLPLLDAARRRAAELLHLWARDVTYKIVGKAEGSSSPHLDQSPVEVMMRPSTASGRYQPLRRQLKDYATLAESLGWLLASRVRKQEDLARVKAIVEFIGEFTVLKLKMPDGKFLRTTLIPWPERRVKSRDGLKSWMELFFQTITATGDGDMELHFLCPMELDRYELELLMSNAVPGYGNARRPRACVWSRNDCYSPEGVVQGA